MEIWIAIALLLAFLSTLDFERMRFGRSKNRYESDYGLYDNRVNLKK